MNPRPRYSIIPAGAVTDRRLEGRDLQVLGFLGMHTSRLGWCFLSQTQIAAQLECGRSTVQRSLARLRDAGWIAFKSATTSGRLHACYAYRVLTDHDDSTIEPTTTEIEMQADEQGCPPVGTSDAEVPTGGQGVPTGGQGVPTYAWAHKEDQRREEVVGAAARARDPLVSNEASEIADAVMQILDIDREFTPPAWCGAALWFQAGLTSGWRPDLIRLAATKVRARKHYEPPLSYRYLRKPIEREHRMADEPFEPVMAVSTDGTTDAQKTSDHRAPWQRSRDRWREAAAKLSASVAADQNSDEMGGSIVEVAAAPRRDRS